MGMHLSTEEITNYLGRKLTELDFDRAGDHVHSCAACYQDFLGELQKRFPIEIDLDELAGMQGWHLEGEELAAFVEGRSDELDFECASLHLEECSSCMQRASTAFEYTLENHRSKKPTIKLSLLWKRPLPALQSNSISRLPLAAAALLLVALTLIAWSVLKPASEKSQLAGATPPETVSPDPSQQSTAPAAPAPDAGSEILKKVDETTSDQLSAGAQSERREARRPESEFERALIAKNLTMPASIEMLDRTPSIVVRGSRASSEAFNLIGPLSTIISTDRPRFRWTALNGAASYTVSVFDDDLHLVRMSEPVADTEWSMPGRLRAGNVYTWIVTALRDGQEASAPGPPARAEFKVLDNFELAELNRLLSKSRSHAARGVLYAEAGLLDEAETELQAHLDLRPHDKRAKRLLRIVQSWRPKNLALPSSNSPQ